MTEANAECFNAFDRKRIFRFMDLPFDVRHHILTYVCTSATKTTRVFLKGLYGSPTTVPLPPIARTANRRVKSEALLVTIKQTTFEIHSGPGNAKFQNWLSSIDLTASGETSLKKGFDAVHSLAFPYFSHYPHASLPVKAPNNDLQLMAKCKMLRKVEITFVSNEVYNHYHGVGVSPGPKPLDQLRRQYRLDTIRETFKHGELRSVVIYGPRFTITQGDKTIDTSHPSPKELATWLKEEYVAAATENPDKKPTVKELSVSVISNGMDGPVTEVF